MSAQTKSSESVPMGSRLSKRTEKCPGVSETIFQTKSHWSVFGLWLLVTLISIAVFILEYPWGSERVFSGKLIFLIFPIACMVCAVWTISSVVLFVTAEYSILPDRVIHIQGRFFGSISEDINLSEIVAVTLRSFNQQENCGTVIILTQDGKNHKLRDIKSPEKFMDYIVNY